MQETLLALVLSLARLATASSRNGLLLLLLLSILWRPLIFLSLRLLFHHDLSLSLSVILLSDRSSLDFSTSSFTQSNG